MESVAEQYGQKDGPETVILIDAVDQLASDEIRDQLHFFPECLSGRLHVILSCLEEFPLPLIPQRISLPLLNEDERRQVVTGILKLYRRELDKCVIESIAQKEEASSPLYVSLLLQRLLMMNKSDFDDIAAEGDGMSAITVHQLEIVRHSAETMGGICKELLDAASQRLGSELAKEAIAYLTVSRHGLREEDMEGIFCSEGMAWSSLDFSLFIHYMESIFVLREDGHYDFAHRIVREEMSKSVSDTKARHQKIANWLKTLPVQDELRRKELVWHLLSAGDEAGFIHCICDCSKQEDFLDQAAADVFLYSAKDEGSFLCGILSGKYRTEINIDFLEFMIFPMYSQADLSDGRTKALLERIFLESITIVQELKKKESERKIHETLALLYGRLGLLKMTWEKEELLEAIGYLNRSLELNKTLALQEGTERDRSALGRNYLRLGRCYYRFEEKENWDQALAFYKESLVIAERLYQDDASDENEKLLRDILEDLGDLYYFRYQQMEEALKYYEHAREICEKIRNVTVATKKIMCRLLREIAQCHEVSDAIGDIPGAIKCRKRACEIREEIVHENKTPQNQILLGTEYIDCADMMEEGEESLSFYEMGIAAFEKIKPEETDDDEKYTLGRAYINAADLCYACGTAADSRKAADYARKAVSIFTELVEKGTVPRASEKRIFALKSAMKYTPPSESAEYADLLIKELRHTDDKERKKILPYVKVLKIASKWFGF
jgi:tetratricopeptide (TPR) repeat protein